MATSKHFPLQKFTNHTENEDYNLNETPYNSVSSFKSYHNNQNRTSVTSAPPYINVFEVTNGTSDQPYKDVKGDIKEISVEDNARVEEPYIDNTVVSAYKGTKPPIPAHKPRVLRIKNSKSRQNTANVNKNKPITNENPESKKFGVENLQSISQQLQDGNKELRRHRNSKELSQASIAKFSNNIQENSDESINDLSASLREDSGVASPDSQNEHENGRHSSMSRRKLPKVPVHMAQSKIMPSLKTDSEKELKAVPNCRAVVPKLNHVVSEQENYENVERKKAVQSENELVAESANVTHKLTGMDPEKDSGIPLPRVMKRFKKGRVRDKNRSLSVGDQTKEIAERANRMMAGTGDVVGRIDVDVNILERNKLKPSANEGFIKSVNTSQQGFSNHSSEHDSEIKADIKSVKLTENSANSIETSVEVCHKHSNNNCDQEEENALFLQNKLENGSRHLCNDKTEDDNVIGSDHDDYSVVETLNNLANTVSPEQLPGNTFFSFDHEVIQQLTDSIMEKTDEVGDTSGDKFETSKHLEAGIADDDSNLINDNLSNKNCDRTTSSKNKLGIEGKSVNEKKVDEIDTNHESKSNISVNLRQDENSDKSDNINKENIVCSARSQKKVERSPSYRKKVMARAKSRHKKSSMLKECSCTRNEKGDIVTCQFCENYENRKRRSRSSLGLESVGINKELSELSEGESSDISSYSDLSNRRRAFSPGLPPLPSSKSPRPLRKLQVSSRVDVLMSSELFKKHLQKHENLLHKHTVLRRAGMRKSVSNLDLSEGYIIDSDSQCDTESVTSEATFETDTSAKDDLVSQSSAKDEFLSQSPDMSVFTNKNSRRHSLTGDSDSPAETLQKSKRKHSRTLPTTVGRSRMPIPSFTQPNFSGSKSRPNIPTFKEFKVMKELSKSTEALNISENESPQTGQIRAKAFSDSSFDHVTCRNDIEKVDNESERVFEMRNEYVEKSKTEELIPVQLEVIKESHSKENLLTLIPTTDVEAPNHGSTQINVSVENNSLSEQKDKIIGKAAQEIHEKRSDFIEPVVGNSNKFIEENQKKIDYHKALTKQQSTPEMNSQKHRVRPKLKSRTMSRLDIDSDGLSDTASGPDSVAFRERRKPGAKRPRSLISKKSSLSSLIQEAEKAQYFEDADSNSDKSIRARPKLKAGHVVNRSKSDSKYEIEKGRESESDSRNDSSLMLEKGKNTVCFDLDDRSQCSPFDIGESETSTSMIESLSGLSDSVRSEVNAEDNLQLFNDQDDTGKLLHDPDDFAAEDTSILEPLKDELVSQVLRSTSDACETTQEAARKRRDRKERPYKSDPFSGTEIIPASKRCVLREEKAKLRQHMDFANSSKEEILTFLDGVSHGDLASCDSVPSLEELNEDDEQLRRLSMGVVEPSRKIRKHLSNVSSLSTDSGVIGQDGSHDSQQSSPTNTLSHSEKTMSSWQPSTKQRSMSSSCSDVFKQSLDCVDCGPQDMVDIVRSQVCPQCLSRRRERRETIQEIIDTEMNYGRDLNILKEEFYKPIIKAGLLSKEQLDAIFLNLDELLHVNKYFITKLKSAVHMATQNNDLELADVMIGSMFLESSTMFLTFENYCVNQAQAPVLLEQLEKEKELLRIFLQVSQNDNHQLRRMHLKSFLMVPVQRIMKYPLLLDRLHKTTPSSHLDKNSLKEAKDKIEDILGHINAKSRTVSFRQRKPSQKSSQHCSVTEKIEVSRVALETLQWNRKDVCDVITSQLQITQPVDHLWAAKKCKNYKFTTVYGVLLTLMQQPNERGNDNDINNMRNNNNNNNNNNMENTNSRVKSAAVVFIKEKSGRYQVSREPFMLEKCVVSQDPDYHDVFEILEWSKEAFLIKADSPQETKLWVQNLRQQMNNLGVWRKRRNALPNILLNHHS
ncbi:uncharacterized protein LOC132725851 [Ruditapes philippinarum]|uniref:uncharacterized protein LOC132725851 n=1 Tax=Ruditapes philippinarum TaxID=129788 RepID=UPI00295AB951|nr:uncharacterized protein LOC132725851 [Ruditapes philippinarum]